jgi:hypothetical protein
MCISPSAPDSTRWAQAKPEESLMAGELNSVQESIKLALDAADAATDVTSEYSQVKREHKKLERKVSQIHRYTTITFVTWRHRSSCCADIFGNIIF